MKEVAFDPRVTVQMVSLLWSSTATTSDKKRTGRPVSLSPTRRCDASPPLSRQRKARRNQSLQSLAAYQSTTTSSSPKNSTDDEQQLTRTTTVSSDLWFTHSELREMRDRDEALCRSPYISKKDSILGLETRQHKQRIRNQLADDAQLQVFSIQQEQQPDEGDRTPVEHIAHVYHFYAEQAREQALHRGVELAYSLGHYSGSSSSYSTLSSSPRCCSKGRRNSFVTKSPTSPTLLVERLPPCLLRFDDDDDEVCRGDDRWMSGSSSKTIIHDQHPPSSSWTMPSTSSSYGGLLRLGGKSLLSSSLPTMPQRR